MVDFNLGGIASVALNITIMVLSVVIFGAALLGGLWVYMQYKRYARFRCFIYERDANNQLVRTGSDTAGIFVDRGSNLKLFNLRKGKTGISPDDVDWISGPGGKKEVYLLRTGDKSYVCLRPNIAGESLLDLEVKEEDVNWGIQAYEKSKKKYEQNKLLQFMPYIALGVVTVGIIVIFMFFFKDALPVLRDAATELKLAAEAIAQASSGTTVIK